MLRFFLIFVALSLLATLAVTFLGVELPDSNYWDHHGMLLLAFLAVLPRLTLLFSSIPFGGLFWWLGFFFCPRYLIAILATLHYWPHNTILVSLAWVIALGGEASEKYVIHRRVYRSQAGDVIDVEATPR